MTASTAAGRGRIRHVVVILRENHTYDNYFGRLPGGDGDATLPDAPNPPRYPDPMKPTHGSVSFLNRDVMAVREQFSERDLALYWEWAREYGLYDRFFSATGGPSTPGHLMTITGDAGGLLNNPYSGLFGRFADLLRGHREPKPPFDIHTLPAELTAHGISWRNYGGAFFQELKETFNSPHTVAATQFEVDAAAGDLPAVSWVYSPTSELNEHAPDNVTDGMNWTARQIEAVVKGGHWEDTAILVVWDDFGGWYDHVPPPQVETLPDGTPYRLGNRLPFLVLSPWSKRGLNSTELSHVSIPRFIGDVFGIAPINKRIATTNGLDSGFDFAQAPLPPPVTSVRRLQQWLDRPFTTSAPVPREAGMSHAELGAVDPAVARDARRATRPRPVGTARWRRLPGETGPVLLPGRPRAGAAPPRPATVPQASPTPDVEGPAGGLG